MDSTINLQRWQQAFEDHPISTTRAIEKQLRSSVANNRERLRGLVGGNYRELLSTADKIVHLDEKTKATELRISDIGRKCGPPDQISRKPVNSEQRATAELWLLQVCLDATGRALATRDILRASRLIIISRLLLKSLQGTDSQAGVLSAFKVKISSLRRRTIKRIDSVLTSPRSKSRSLVQAACAHCLVTSGSATEVFQYTLRLRLEKLQDVSSVDSAQNSANEILQYMMTTLQVLRRVFGRPLADGLGNLQRRAILKDLDLVGSEVVASNEVLLLISEDIRSFSPYFKREPVSPSDAAASLSSWASDACQVFTKVLQGQASKESSVAGILALRSDFLSIILPRYFDSKAGDVLCRSLAAQVTARVTQLGESHVAQMAFIADELTSAELPLSADLSLWSSGLANMRLVNGSEHFLKQVHKRYHGHGSSLVRILKSLDEWVNAVTDAVEASKRANSNRWRDILEEPSEEQEDEAAQAVDMLSEKEPQQILEQIEEFVKTSLDGLATRLMDTTNAAIEQDAGTDMAVYYLRVVRGVIKPLRRAFPHEAAVKNLEELIPKIHQTLATRVATQVLGQHLPGLAERDQVSIEALPSPAAFNLLQGLCDAMQKVGGSDIWSRDAVKGVKQALRHELFPTDKEGAVESEFDRAFLACAFDGSDVSTQASAQTKSAESYWQRTRSLFGILAG